MMGSLLIMALVGFALVFVLRMFTRPKTEGNLQFAGAGNQPASAPPSLAPGIGAEPAFGGEPRPNIPVGFDTEGFLRQAKLNFVKLQAVHDSGKLDELREFTSDAMFESIKQDLLQHGAVGQQTDVVTLNAELLEAITEGDTHWASVRFSGMIRENPDAQPEAFEKSGTWRNRSRARPGGCWRAYSNCNNPASVASEQAVLPHRGYSPSTIC